MRPFNGWAKDMLGRMPQPLSHHPSQYSTS